MMTVLPDRPTCQPGRQSTGLRELLCYQSCLPESNSGKGTMSGLWITVFTLPLLWTPITAIAPSPDDTLCPVNCSCSWLQRLVQCANASLSALPTGIANNTVELDLQHNSFSILSSGFFPDLPEITSLYLGSSHILQVASGAFKGVRNLYHLHLDNNLLEQLPQDVFVNMTNLIFLHLQHNQITYLPPGVFSSLKQLSVLDLSHNLLGELSDQALGGLSQLRRLYLTANRISNVSVRILPRSLRTLSLDQNQLESVPTVIRTSVTLSILQLSGNPIRKLTSLSFGRRLRSLNQLFLDSLSLEKITALAFTRLHRLEVLSLRNNSLESLPSLASMRSLSALYLTENKWCCDCSLIWLRTWQKKVTQQDRSPVECSSPRALQGQLLVDIELQKLTCPPFGTDFTTVNPAKNNTPVATVPSLPQAATTLTTTTSTALITIRGTTTTRLATSQNHPLARWDPCLASVITSVSIRPKSDTSLVVAWSFAGDHDQFEVRYKEGKDEQVLRVIGELPEVELHGLLAGTEYRVCVIPQNEHLLECLAPAPQQCGAGHTTGHLQPIHAPLGHSHSAVGTGVAVTLLVLVVLAVVTIYRLRARPIQFQRHYDEDESFPHRSSSSSINQAKVTMGPVYENIEDDDQHVYMTAASQGPEEKVDCTLVTPPWLTPTPTYVTL
ncbi:PREDICTED: leucine-rich repeat-containing protein 4C-like isoform X1 [Gavialis gangeticus]|uniref:leucine-rich repeat-containing protein 4C-like isoform X1 n=2 Tax=Gavialis gangeticus TaxID=94835 RepID=UPI00092EC62E|nr:PREDICTED: leucine-rich repeat-containing protein 4C-like isoform X1 [Gavialis gangeticus]